jgi:catechol 2,3-dioxygenase-like lactoylglutathione lyase family enzyme
MEQRISLVTIGVKDLDAMKAFYTGSFGWKTMNDNEGIAFFRMNGIMLGLYPEDELAEDISIKNDGEGFRRMTLAIVFRSEDEVNQAFTELKSKGVKVVKEPAKVFWGGYSGYVSDIEDNYWELAFNPFLEMDREGNIISQK